MSNRVGNSVGGRINADSAHAPPVVCVGTTSLAGTYVLRIRVLEEMKLAFGRFKSGEKFDVVPGDYAYVGSAMGKQGSTCLPYRLGRHATRTGRERPHAIRQEVVKLFAREGVNECKMYPSEGKQLKWNVDHLLDQRPVSLIGVIAIRSTQRIEFELAKMLCDDETTVVFAQGLGAGDNRKGTHLVRVEAGDEWWQGLPTRIKRLLRRRGSAVDSGDSRPSKREKFRHGK